MSIPAGEHSDGAARRNRLGISGGGRPGSPVWLSLLAILLALTVEPVWAVKIADITRIAGTRTNVLTGLGLVMGLKGTGDGGKYLPAIRPLVAMLGKFNDPAT